MNTTNKTIAPISATDGQGVEWTFDTATGRWNALAGGKKISSKDFTLLKTKVDAALAGAQDDHGKGGVATSKSADPEVKAMEVAMVRLEYETLHGPQKAVNHGKISLHPVVAKIEWDAASGQMKLIRYKEKSRQGESGWKTHRADTMLLIHPQFLTPEMRQLMEASAKAKLVGAAFGNTERLIAKDWWAAKEDTTQSWSLEHQKGLVESKPGAYYDRTRHAHTSAHWTMDIAKEPMDFAAWQRTPEGHLAQGDVQVRMLVQDRFTPSFGVYVEGEPKPLFKDISLDLVMQLAQATHSIRSQPANPVAQWHAGRGWERDKGSAPSWPSAYTVHGGAVAIVPRDRYSSLALPVPQAYMLAVKDDEREWKPDQYSKKDGDLANVCWKTANDSFEATVFCDAGPEDRALDLLKQLRKDRAEVAEKLALAPITVEALEQACANTVRDVCGAIEDGEELASSIEQIEPMITRMLTNFKNAAERDETIKAWQQTCDDTLEAARKQLAETTAIKAGSGARKNSPR